MRTLLIFVIMLINTQLFANKLIIGTVTYSPPFEMLIGNKNNFVGFDIDLMNTICDRLHATCEYKPLPFKAIFPAIDSGEIDLAIAAININAEREARYLFSLPYLIGQGQVLTKLDSKITNYSDLDGKRIGVESGSLFEMIAKNRFKKSIVVTFDRPQDFLLALSNNTIDAVLFDGGSAEYSVDNNFGSYKLIGARIHMGHGYGIVANLNNKALINSINLALLDIEKDGTYLKIYKRFWGLKTS